MHGMFGFCSSLKKIELFDIKIKNIEHMRGMFYECPEELKNKIRILLKNNQRAFYPQGSFWQNQSCLEEPAEKFKINNANYCNSIFMNE